MLQAIAAVPSVARVSDALLILAMAWATAGSPVAAQEEASLVILDPEGVPLATFDRAQLAAMPQTEFTTRTIWTEGPQHFEGVSLATLLERHGITANRLDLDAANDYTVSLPADEIGPVYPVVTHSRNGAPMSLREKGPFWLLWNYDSDPAFRRETVYTRSIWQLARITVHPETD